VGTRLGYRVPFDVYTCVRDTRKNAMCNSRGSNKQRIKCIRRTINKAAKKTEENDKLDTDTRTKSLCSATSLRIRGTYNGRVGDYKNIAKKVM